MVGWEGGFFLFIVSIGFCSVRYVSILPLLRGSAMVISVLLKLPLVRLRSKKWVKFFFGALFLRGVFVLLMYFSKLSTVMVSLPRFNKIVFVFILLFFPVFVYFDNEGGLEWIFMIEGLFYICFMILFILGFLCFVRFVLRGRKTMRRG